MRTQLPYSVHFIVLALLGLILQEVILDTIIPSWLPRPHILVVLLVVLGFTQASVRGCILAFLLGFLLDLNSGEILGPWAGSFIVGFALMLLLAQRIYMDNFVSLAVLVVVADIVTMFLWCCFVAFVPSSGSKLSYISLPWTSLLFQGVCSGLFAPLFVRFCSLYKFQSNQSTKSSVRNLLLDGKV